MTIKNLISIFFPILKQHESSNVRLDKVQKSRFEQFCEKACPYVLLIALVLLTFLILIILVKYGHSITGTEANNWYYHMK